MNTRRSSQFKVNGHTRLLRITGRLVWLAGEILLAGMGYIVHAPFRGSALLPTTRALWLQRHCRRVLRVFNVSLQTTGVIPARGLLVCNHLSYLDILVIGALAPAAFVAKREMRNWPVLGWFAMLAGTVFVHRGKRSEVTRSTAEIKEVLRQGTLLVLFPEGTSSGGDTVLPFKSALLEPAAEQKQPLAAGCIQYSLSDGSVADEVCYWRDMTLVPHLVNLLGKRGVSARVSFTQLQNGCGDRKQLARQLHSEVVRLKEAFSI
ncbi:MAG TPA: lysophospholipid acyltransferase family protein [Haliangiales bacterium]|nr:lysophospholipid acyltransferase family protein [Haliangiales bacterium]